MVDLGKTKAEMRDFINSQRSENSETDNSFIIPTNSLASKNN